MIKIDQKIYQIQRQITVTDIFLCSANNLLICQNSSYMLNKSWLKSFIVTYNIPITVIVWS